MGWLEKIDFKAFSESVLWTLFMNLSFSVNIDLLIERNDISLGGLNGANDE
jgi:hypothetical protein